MTLLPLVVLLVSTGCMVEDDSSKKIIDKFDSARKLVEQSKKGGMSYDLLCSEIEKGGHDKIACHLSDFPSVGLLVCKAPKYGRPAVSCQESIQKELRNLMALQDSYKIKTIEFDEQPINEIKCGEKFLMKSGSKENACSGLLIGWVERGAGIFQHIRDHIAHKTVRELIDNVVSITTKEGLKKTTVDLEKIVTFMAEDPGEAVFRQICELQGFFLTDGGFLVNGPVEIFLNIPICGRCWNNRYDPEPTTADVYFALRKMVAEFKNIIINGPSKNWA